MVLDIARQYGDESTQVKTRIGRLVNRAATLVIGHDRNWSWLKITSSFTTSASTETYSLDKPVRQLLHFYAQGDNRRVIKRIPSTQFRQYVPNPSLYSGLPTMWDEQGVDSTGSKIISLFPVPTAVETIYYQYFRHILPIKQDQQDLWSYWGMPPNVIECVIQMATALMFKGIDDDRYQLERGEAEAMTADAFGADQSKGGNTVIRSPMNDPDAYISGDPMLPPAFGTL